MSDHAKVTEEHRKLATRLKSREPRPLEWYEHSWIEWAAELLADFARDERLKEVTCANNLYWNGSDLEFENWLADRMAKLKRGEA